MIKSVLLDTGVWANSLQGTEGLSANALARITSSQTVYVSPISVYEIGQKCRIGKWDEMLPFLEKLPSILTDQGAHWAPMTAQILLGASTLEWDHRDPFDRIIAATAKIHALHVVTTDRALSEFMGKEQVTN